MMRRMRMMQDEETGEVKKGPWKPEEDQVLINHVKKHGPRDWSSIRSKGLLHRTGKSCRLRWVNKLRPDLKTGVKFSADEERTVIDLQAEFGNKWARIATYLPGRTDNDVKNFWSSRKKRLARILHASDPSSSSTKMNPSREPVPLRAYQDNPPGPKFSPLREEEPLQNPPQEPIKMVPFPDTMSYPITFGYDPFPEPQPQLCFAPGFSLLTESQDFITRFGEPSFLEQPQIAMDPSIFMPETNCEIMGGEESQDAVDLNSFIIDDFPPVDIFDDIERIPSPSDWL